VANVKIRGLNGEEMVEKRLYLDSGHLRQQLVHEPTFGDDLKRLKKHLSIFVFSLAGAEPLLIDKYYQARSLGNMVIGVQSDHQSWPSHYFCNSELIYWNLRDPTSALLLATSQALFGILPNTLSYNDLSKKIWSDYVWSVGDNPHSITSVNSNAGHFTGFHIDQIRRQQAILIVEDLCNIINEGVERLDKIEIENENLMIIKFLRRNLTDLSRQQDILDSMIPEVQNAMTDLDFEQAVNTLENILPLAKQFRAEANELANHVERVTCGIKQKNKQKLLLRTLASSTEEPGWLETYNYLILLMGLNFLVLALLIAFQGKTKSRVKVD